jgi:hypothetical protein
MANKNRVIKSLDTVSDELKAFIKQQYPNGYEDSITRIQNAKRESIFVFPLETEETAYLLKVPATKNSAGGYDIESDEREEFDEEDDYKAGSGDADAESTDSDPSYDPDFDN